MLLWRVSEFIDLSGEGGFRFSGRWNSGGRHVVYTAEHSALALLEQLGQLLRRTMPPDYQLLRIEVPGACNIVAYPHDSPPADRRESLRWGDEWLERGESALARVPSAMAPHAFNYLINPAHADAAQIRVTDHRRHGWDARLFR